MQKHILHRLSFEINAPSEMNGKQLQQDISNLIKKRVLEIIETVFDKIGDDKNIRIPKLELEINDVQSDNWEEKFTRKFTQQLSYEINEWEENNLKTTDSTYQSGIPKEDTLFYFLENGTLPWHNNSLTINELKTYFHSKIESKIFQTTLIELVQTNENALKRLVFQFENQELNQVLKFISTDSIKWISFFKTLEKLYSKWWNPNEVRLKIWKSFLEFHFEKKLNNFELQNEIIESTFLFFTNSITSKKKKEKLKSDLFEELNKTFKTTDSDSNSFFQNISKQEEKFKEVKNQIPPIQTKESSNQKSISNQEGYYINNAGLIILHPFFQYLFEDIGFTKDGQFTNQHHQQQAALALHHLVTGKEIAFEPDLILNKILCNIPIQDPIENQLLLDEKLRIECENLLNATIQHWSALKSTSIEGLRNTFIKREGKISQKENGDWLLQVQGSGVDILLSKLPWGIRIVNLPWMEGNIFVEWI